MTKRARSWFIVTGALALGALVGYLVLGRGQDHGNGLTGRFGGPPPESNTPTERK